MAVTNVIRFPLIDGPLIEPQSAARLDLVQRMAADLVASGVLFDRRDAVRFLLRLDYPSMMVVRCVDDVMALAYQPTVAEAMTP